MVISEIIGGLGNQMFQYAAGRSLAERLGVPHTLDIGAFTERGYALHAFALDRLRAPLTLATPGECLRLRGSRSRVLPRNLRKALLERRSTFYREPTIRYDARFEALKHPIYLEGYFQSERYFQAIAPQLREWFLPKEELSRESLELAAQIEASPCPVMIHVRRGDFVSDPRNEVIHGTCSETYYQSAVEEIVSQHPDAQLFAFSDEPDWVEAHLRFSAPIKAISRNPAERNQEDLYLMSICRHAITANSSFSWWGAWLGEAEGQIVICPKRWFTDPAKQDHDLIPARWRQR